MAAAVLGAFGALVTGLIVWVLKMLYQVDRSLRVIRFALFGNGVNASRDRRGAVPVLDAVADLERRVAVLERREA